MNRGEISRERGNVVVILAGVISERGFAQFAASPGEIEGMSEQMFRGDLAIDGVEMFVHKLGSPDALVVIVGTAQRELFLIHAAATSHPGCV